MRIILIFLIFIILSINANAGLLYSVKRLNSNEYRYIDVSSDYVARKDDYFIRVDTTSAPVQITLPTDALKSNNVSVVYIVKDVGGQAATNNITVIGESGELIDGSASFDLDQGYQANMFFSGGAEFNVGD